ncbi:MAG: uracil-DNA glycosylase [Candidatus Bathyarchaeota archaeon]|nr:uracil-DNA glycosylase [Candidatus Bathyarchaeota archaeon]MDD4325897.1 uracil-DNA glycosylase [Candidatus Bathyarchaeota archaeon]MDI9577310.1 uracil-DNA glycosylase [Thermoproteota archaeon]MDT8782602.1 uracil-DNA glycosylase [Candidatus Bathyarchaeota archaeon]NLD66540.1 uracil-DNA glycosylase [Thermoproteota archaeon]
MEALNSEIYSCRRCLLWQNAKNSVPGEGPINAKVMFIGQNPGAEEDQKGKPFIGRAGKFLTKTLSDFGIKREDIFITNIVKHVSPKNRKPTPDEVAACLPYLVEQIEMIKPKIIVLLGASAKQTPRINGIEYCEVIHPSAAMRFTKMREKFMLQLDTVAKKISSLK